MNARNCVWCSRVNKNNFSKESTLIINNIIHVYTNIVITAIIISAIMFHFFERDSIEKL